MKLSYDTTLKMTCILYYNGRKHEDKNVTTKIIGYKKKASPTGFWLKGPFFLWMDVSYM